MAAVHGAKHDYYNSYLQSPSHSPLRWQPAQWLSSLLSFFHRNHPAAGLLKQHHSGALTDQQRLTRAERGVQRGYRHATRNDWSLKSQRNYLLSTQAAVRDYHAVDPDHPRLKTLRTHEANIARDITKLAEQRVNEGYEAAVEGEWSLESQLSYLNNVQQAVQAYRAVDPKHPRLQDLLKLRNDIATDVQQKVFGDRTPDLSPKTERILTDRAEALVRKGYEYASDSDWSAGGQGAYLYAVHQAIDMYRLVDPKHPRLKDLLKLQNDLSSDVHRALDG